MRKIAGILVMLNQLLIACGKSTPEQPTTEPAVVRETLEALKSLLPQQANYLNEATFVHAVSTAIHDNSIHDSRQRPASYGYLNVGLYAELMLRYLNGTDAALPYLQCGDRAIVMVRILLLHGISARLVNLYDGKGSGHLLLEWYSVDAGKWLLEDPDYLVYYRDIASGAQLSLTEVIRNDPATFISYVRGVPGWTYKADTWSAPPANLRDNGYFSIGYIKQLGLTITKGGN